MKNKEKTTARVTWKGLKYALLNGTNRSFYLSLIALGIVAWGFFHFNQAMFGFILGGLAALVFVLLMSTSLLEYNTAVAHNKFAMLSTWAQGAGSDTERAARWGLLAALPLDAVWEQSSLEYDGPRYNTDGTLMGPGFGTIDMNGSGYGSTDLMSASFNTDTGTWADPANAYNMPDGAGDAVKWD